MTTRIKRPKVGQLNRIISIEKPTVARDSFGSEILTWGELAEVWANVQPAGAEERYRQESNREQSLRRAIFRIRYRDDVYEIDRIVDDAGLIWDIEGIVDLPGRRYRDLIAAADVSGAPET